MSHSRAVVQQRFSIWNLGEPVCLVTFLRVSSPARETFAWQGRGTAPIFLRFS